MDTTPLGFPYAEPGDAVTDWPAVSQALAELLETKLSALEVASVRAIRGTSFSIANTTDVAIPFTGADTWETAPTMHDGAGATPTRIFAPVTGKYLVTATIQAVSDPGAANDWNVWIKKQSTTDYGRQRSRSTTGAGYVNVSDVVDLAAGEYIEIWSRQNSGGALAMARAEVTMTKVAA